MLGIGKVAAGNTWDLGRWVGIVITFHLAWPPVLRAMVYGCIAVAVTVLGSGAAKPFIYFEF